MMKKHFAFLMDLCIVHHYDIFCERYILIIFLPDADLHQVGCILLLLSQRFLHDADLHQVEWTIPIGKF